MFATVDVRLENCCDSQSDHQQCQRRVRMPAREQPRPDRGGDTRRSGVEHPCLAEGQPHVHRRTVDDHDARGHRARELGESADHRETTTAE
jgi:hypothetical protein